jgi:hypothetical protein
MGLRRIQKIEMVMQLIPEKAQRVLLEDATRRNRTTARRMHLLNLLWNERYLTRSELIARLEGMLGKGCFGNKAWEDIFYRDMRVVREAYWAAGYKLAYSRSKGQPGYFLRDQPRVNPEVALAIEGSIAEVDSAQIAIYQSKTPAERFRQGCMISDTARKAVTHRIQEKRPELSKGQAGRLAVGRRGTADG